MRKTLKFLLVLLSITLFSCTITTNSNDDVTEKFKIEYSLNGGAWKSGFTAPAEYTKGKEVSLPGADSILKTGYSFGGWYEKSDFSGSSVEKVSKSSSGNKTFYAKWNESTDTKYTVKHFLQNVSGEGYEEVADDVQNLTGTTGAKTAAVAKSYTGFTVKTFEQINIAADGSTVVSIYYDRNTITYTFNADGGNWNGSIENQTLSGLFGAKVPVQDNPVKDGFFFTGWNAEIPESFGEEDLTFNAGWSTSVPETAGYKVEHWKQNVNGNDYEIAESDTQALTGATADKTEAKAYSYTGFTAKAFEQSNIAADGSTIVKIYYDRNTITYTFNANGGNWDGSTENQTVSGLYSAAVKAPADPVLTGYKFGGWNETVPSEFGAADLSFTASWTASTDTAYKVEHWKQNVNGKEYTKAEDDTQSLTGTTADTTKAAAKSYEGFTARTITQGTIAADGSTVVKVYYDRNTITYTFKANGGSWDGSTADKTASGLFGAKVTAPALPSRAGYTAGWDAAVPETFGSKNLTFTAKWTAGTNTTYRVQHWQQNVNDDEYTLISSDTQTLEGTTGGATKAAAKSYEGFTAKAVTQGTIAADGSTVIRIDYDRNIITYTFESGEGKWKDGKTSQTVTGKFGATTSAPESSPVRTGYNFTGWGTIPQVFGKENLSFTATWTEGSGIAYKVEHYQQNVENDGYTLVSSQTEYKTGTTGSATEASAKEFEGFTAKAVTQGTIAADGSTVVRIEYDRNTITYTFSASEGSWSDGKSSQAVSGRFGAAVSISNPSRIGYSFNSWDSTVPSTFGAENKNFSATWTADTNTRYTVQHWQQKTSGTEYEIVSDDTETLYGTTGSETNAQSKSYTGFTAKGVTQDTIAADGSTVIRIDYDRITTTYTFSSGEGEWNDGSTSKIVSGRFGTAVTKPADPVCTGWTFSGWLEKQTSTSVNIPETFGKDGAEYIANWTANTNTAYTVEHWQQNIDDDRYTKVDNDTESKQGTTGESTAALAKTYTGFTAKTFTQGTIEADGSTVVRIDYDRDVISYTFYANGENETGGCWDSGTPSQASVKTVSGKFGSAVTAPENPSRVGYTFSKWNANIPQTFGAGNLSFTAEWTANTDTAYSVVHMQQNIDNDNYTKVDADTESKQGTTGALTAALAKTYTGFKLREDVEQIAIAPDGSTVVYIYYNRESITYTFNAAGGNWNGDEEKAVTGRFGAAVNISAPTYEGRHFEGWDKAVPATFGTETLSFTAQWSYINGNGIGITVISSDINVTVSASTISPTFTAEEGYLYSWYIDDEPAGNSQTCTVDKTTLTKGIHTIALEAQKGGKWYSYYAQIPVGVYIVANASNIASTITGMTESGTVIVTGALSTDDISDIKSALNTLSTTHPNVLVELDLSQVTGLTSLESESFKYCNNLSEIVIPDTVTTLGGDVFFSCTGLTSIIIPNSMIYFGNSVFRGCTSLTSITIPDCITQIEKSMFDNCKSLASITIPNSVTLIREEAFADCAGLTSITIPDSVTQIEDAAFYDCKGLKSITISKNLTLIGDYAFTGCKSLTSITIPNSVTQIGCHAFDECTELTSITFENPSNWYYTSDDEDWNNFTNGTAATFSDNESNNATALKSTYLDYYLYRKD